MENNYKKKRGNKWIVITRELIDQMKGNEERRKGRKGEKYSVWRWEL